MRVTHIITTIKKGGAENQLFTLVKTQRTQKYQVENVVIKGRPELKVLFEQSGVVIYDLSHFRNPAFQIFAFRNILKKSNPDFVHAHLPRIESILKLSTLFMKIRRVYARHNQEAFFPEKPKFISNMLSKFVSMNAYGGIAISSAVRSYCVARGEIYGERKITQRSYNLLDLSHK